MKVTSTTTKNQAFRKIRLLGGGSYQKGNRITNFARGYFLGKYGRQTYQEDIKISEDNFHLDIELKLNPPSDIAVVAYGSIWGENYLRVDIRLCCLSR